MLMSTKLKFEDVAVNEGSPNWKELSKRQSLLYERPDDVRTPFARDYTRILHSMAYRRLKHKTQVFFNIDNDHICTRMEHVAHVESVSYTIAKSLGLNTELTKAIAIGHDLGHAPFGHQGEHILSELLSNNYSINCNLDLTYAVRDGIISHCGEVDENGLRPRTNLIDLEKSFNKSGDYLPATWEGCVVKLSDKIAYVGRDIEDAISLGFLVEEAQNELKKMARANDENALNSTVIMHNLIIDICQNSSPEKGICLSERFFDHLSTIKKYNYQNIYAHKRFIPFKEYSKLVINQLFDLLYQTYDGSHSWSMLDELKNHYPLLVVSFEKWLAKYCDIEIVPKGELKEEALRCENQKIYGKLETKEIYVQAIIDFISGMTDRFAVKSFNELITY